MPFGENSYPNGITNTAMTARARPTELLRWMVIYVYLIHFKAASYHMSTTEINNVSLNPVIFKFLLKNWTHRCTKISSSTELHTRRCGKQDSSEKWAGMWSQHPPPPIHPSSPPSRPCSKWGYIFQDKQTVRWLDKISRTYESSNILTTYLNVKSSTCVFKLGNYVSILVKNEGI